MFIHKHQASIACAIALAIGAGVSQVQAAPANIGSGLDKVLKLYQKSPSNFISSARELKWMVMDEDGRVLVNVYLNGTLSLDNVKAKALSLNCVHVAEDASYAHGVISVWVHPSHLEALAAAAGVESVVLSPRPFTNVGSVTAQGSVVHHTDQVNKAGIIRPKGVLGSGITIGILSDSYNKAKGGKKAADGVASRDLPGTGNPDNPQPVVVLADIPKVYATAGLATDEGRGMAEIIHDLAPKAKLCFATAYSTDIDFANNIRSLRTDPRALCDIIVDDVGYATEPMFSDGVIAKAVDEVVGSTTIPGKKVAYFSSAGNAGANGFSDTFRFVAPAAAVALTNQNLKWGPVPTSLYAGGVHNFITNGSGVDVSQTLTPSGAKTAACFQWDDPFHITNGMTANYNILVFDADGNYLPDSSLVDDNFSTNEPVEYPLTLKDGVTYQIVICRTSQGNKAASRLRYVERTASLSGEYLSTNAPTTYGHNSSANGNGVAAYVYDGNPSAPGFVPAIESYTSNGPVVIAFDANGKRLAPVVTRQKPDFAAADGQNTSFFPPGDISTTDYEGDGFPNFFGTSAAAPTAAAIAGLVLETAGGPGSITPLQIKNYLKGSVSGTRDFDPRLCTATVSSGNTKVTITANGDDPFDPNFFKVSFAGPQGQSLTRLYLNVKPAGLELDPDPETGFPFTFGTTKGVTLNGAAHSLTQPTSSGGFQFLTVALSTNDVSSGDGFNFGIDRDTANVGSGGNSADLLAGATVDFTIAGYGTLSATFANFFSSGFNYADGVGFLDALKACQDAKP